MSIIRIGLKTIIPMEFQLDSHECLSEKLYFDSVLIKTEILFCLKSSVIKVAAKEINEVTEINKSWFCHDTAIYNDITRFVLQTK